MAFKRIGTKGSIKVISSLDPSVEKTSREDFEEYLKTGNEGHLTMEGEPTRFVLRRSLDFDSQKAIQNEQVDFSPGRETKIALGFMMEEVRRSLVDIENPEGVEDALEFKRDSDGYASKDLIAELGDFGVVSELFAARRSALGDEGGLKKK